jgi:hypothetical protein
MIRLPHWLASSLLFLPSLALAQSQFALRVQQGNNIVQVLNGSSLAISSPAPGTSRSLQVLVTYIGSTSVTFPDGATILGSPDFVARPTSGGTPGSRLGPNQTATIEVVFTPSSTSQALAQLDLSFAEAAPPSTDPNAPPGQSTRGLLTLNLSGGVPVYALNYTVGSSGNTIVLAPNGQLVFPDTVTNSATTAAVVLANRGSGAGQVNSVSISGTAFTLAALPALPVVLNPSLGIPFQVVYLPRQAGNDAGTLTIGFEGGVSQTYQLQGHAVLSQLSYEVIPPGSGPSPIPPGQTIQFPQTAVGQITKMQIRYTNISGADFTINTLTVTGPPYSLSDLPFVPSTLAPNATGVFTLSFTPTVPGRLAGSLRIGNDSFPLSGEAFGPALSYSYRASADTPATTVDAQGQVVLPPAAVGQSSSVQFIVENRGTATATLNSVGVSAGAEIFSILGLPPLPYRLQPQSSVSFSIQFQPNNTVFANGTLRIDSTVFSLSGLGGTAVPLPDYTITGPTQIGALEQPALALTLSQAYPIALNGTLNLTVASEYGADPSVQFITGGRTVNFTIPANTTKAVFPNGAAQIPMQTGSVAGTVTVVPTFATQGSLDLTPKAPSVLRMVMPTAAPRILGIQVAERSVNTLTLRVLGLTTTRSLGKMDILFTAVPGFDIPNLSFTVDLTGASGVWFSSTASQTFGGQFSLDVQFLLATSDRSTTATPPTQALQSVAVTVGNSTGVSNTATLSLH